MDYYIHTIPGRLRVKIPLIKGDSPRAFQVQELLESLDGVESVAANTLTGSVVVNYDSDILTDEQLLGILERHNYFDESRAITNEEYMLAGGAIGKAVFGWAVGKAFEGTGLSFLAVLI